MLDFKLPQLSDMAWVEDIMKNSGEDGCEYCFGNLYMWGGVYGNTIAKMEGLFFARDDLEEPMYLYPCGNGDKREGVELLIEYSRKNDNKNLELYSLTQRGVNELQEMFPNKFSFQEDRDFFDYIYNTEDLINLKGKKYHGKRNHIAYFEKTYHWQFEEINDNNMDDCLKMNDKWESLNRSKNPQELDNEKEAILRAFNNYDYLGFKGGLLRVDGEVVAYTLGEEINKNVFCTHIEKAFGDVRGAYPMINREFAKNMLSSYKYINREEDTGSPGLRKAKLSYYPAILLPKFTAKYEG